MHIIQTEDQSDHTGNQTHYEELQKAVESIRALEANVLGVVITDVSEQNKPYGAYKSYKAYDYEYGKA